MKTYIYDRLHAGPVHPEVVVQGSTPVLAFGPFRTARTATLGINPSCAEFIDATKTLYPETRRRLATLPWLGVETLAGASDEALQAVVDQSDTYFRRQPYMKWFGKFREVLASLDADYLNGSACHLDLVQWATLPIWRGLTGQVQRDLVDADASFLTRQISEEMIEVVLVNGSTAMAELRRSQRRPIIVEHVETITSCSYQPCKVYAGRINERVQLFGWSTNLQSSLGVKPELATRLAKLIRGRYAAATGAG